MTAIDHDPRPLPRDNDNLFTHALGGARISRLGEVTLVMIQGEGAFAAPAREFGIARRWAETRPRRATAARSREASARRRRKRRTVPARGQVQAVPLPSAAPLPLPLALKPKP